MLYFEGKTSWDGYNEVIDFMSDYILQYYGLPSVTAQNKVVAEKGVRRTDLDAPSITAQDFEAISSRMNRLQIPQTQGVSREQLCEQLSALSLQQ